MDARGHSLRFLFAFKPALLGAGLPFCAFLVLTQNNSPVLELMGKNLASRFVLAIMAGLLLGCLLTLVMRRAQWPRAGQDMRVNELMGTARLTGTLVIAAICLLFTILAGLGQLATLPLMMGGALVGLAFVPLLFGWAMLYARELPENSLFYAALSLMLASLLNSMAIVPVLQDFPLLYAALLVCAAELISRRFFRASAKGSSDTTELLAASLGREGSLPLLRIVQKLWKPLLGGSIATLIIGLVWDPIAAEVQLQTAKTGLFAFLMDDLVSPLLAVILVIAAFLIRPSRFSLHIYNDIVMPVAIAILLVVPLLDFEGVDMHLIIGLLSKACITLVALAVWTSLAAGARTLGERPWVIFGLGGVFFALSMLFGMFAIHVIGTNGRVLCLALLTLFLVLMVLDVVLREKPQGASRERMKEALEHFLQHRCDELAERAGLSAREREVFLYLARGYSQIYIAKELYVSESTIRTHVHHIYQKLNINSREDLLQLIDAE